MSLLETPGDANQLSYKALGTYLDNNYTDIHIHTCIFSTTHKEKKKKKIPACNVLRFMEDILYIQMTSLIYYAS